MKGNCKMCETNS